jgi:uncharacterized tellurite resistance protein B-like protein
MPKDQVIMPLAKVIIAAAWADGELTNDEVNSLKDLLFHMPDMTARDWAQLEMYIDSPVDEAERERLIADLQSAMASNRDKELAINELDQMVHADGELTPEEEAVVEEIKTAIEDVDTGIFGGMGRLVRGPVSRRSQKVANAPNRELYFEDFLSNRIYYNIRLRLDLLNEEDLPISEAELRKFSLAGGLMARVAYVNRDASEAEYESMRRALGKCWQIGDEEAAVVIEVAISEISKDLDYYRLSREFFECTTEAERLCFLDVLFAVADGDGRVSYEEIEEIRTIANMLKLTHKQFIDAKLKIPRERRAG